MKKRARSNEHILWFSELRNKDVELVGGKNASLGEMYQLLTKKGVRIPNGFAITANAYRHYIKTAGIDDSIQQHLKNMNYRDLKSLKSTGKTIRGLFMKHPLPKDLQTDIINAYTRMSKQYRSTSIDVAVRSSATAEDLPTASFAGQQETYLNIRGAEALIKACQKCFASLFTDRAIAYREEKKFDHSKVYLSVGVQKMVQSQTSGVMFTIDTDTGFRDAVVINAAYGLGENVVQGKVNPDQYTIYKGTLSKHKPIVAKKLGDKSIRMIYTRSGREPVKNVTVSQKERDQYCITDNEILTLAKWGVIIEDHYTHARKSDTPMDIEWARDNDGKLYIVQARPETVQSQKQANILERYVLKKRGTILCSGQSVGAKIGSGKAHVIKNVKDISRFKEGEVLITEMTDPDWVPIMRKASAIVTNSGGRTCHAAIVSRELGIPCIVGTRNSTTTVKNGKPVTVSCAEGDIGYVYQGSQPFEIKKTNLGKLPKTKTTIMLNLGDPTQSFEFSSLPVKGIGLARQEFVITTSIKIHPQALIDYPKVPSSVKKQIDALTPHYADKKQFFIDTLAQGLAQLAAGQYPHDCIVRLSDFKTNEYAGLIGGKAYEPNEDNPMIGWRGASRYYHPNYRDAFALECKAIKKARDEMGLTNIKVMIPFCRTPEEGKKVLDIMKKHGLVRGKGGLEVYVMCEIPSNVILAEDYAKIFDGFSIGSNDLTQLALGVDRDSEVVSDLFDERNDAVKQLIRTVVNIARKHKRKIGICGDAPSTHKDFARFLVDANIDSMSLTPDAVIPTILEVAKAERKGAKR